MSSFRGPLQYSVVTQDTQMSWFNDKCLEIKERDNSKQLINISKNEEVKSCLKGESNENM